MRTWLIYGVGLATVLFLVGGCAQQQGGTATKPATEKKAEKSAEKMTAKCPKCGMAMKEGQLCTGCNCVATAEKGTVHCPVCTKDFKAGEYDARCDRFMFKDQVKNSEGKMVAKGTWDPRLQIYVGLPMVTKDKKTGKPCPKM